MAGQSKRTKDPKVIRNWVEDRGGSPACVKHTGGKKDAGLLRIDFPGYSGEDTLEHIDWDEFFDKFKEKDLTFLYQDTTSDGSESRFCKFIYAGDDEDEEEDEDHSSKSHAKHGSHSENGKSHEKNGHASHAKHKKVPDGESLMTKDHGRIREWVEQRGGSPACVKDTGGKKDPGLLRIDFPGYSGEDTLEHIQWDEFFEKFDEKDLTFLYQETTADGDESRFCKFIYGAVSVK